MFTVAVMHGATIYGAMTYVYSRRPSSAASQCTVGEAVEGDSPSTFLSEV